DTISARRDDPIGVQRILDALVHPPQDVVVEAIAVHYRILESRRTAILAPTVLGADADDLVDVLAQRFVAVLVLVHRHRSEQHERARPAGHRRTDHEQGYAEPGAFAAHDAIGFDQTFAGARNNRRKPDMPVAWIEVAEALRADREDLHAGYAEARLGHLLHVFGRQRQLDELRLRWTRAFKLRKPLLHVVPLRADDLLRSVERH